MRPQNAATDLRVALSDEIDHAMAELDAATPRAIHRCRVRLKRARALAHVSAAATPGLASVFIDLARGVMHMLAPARDLAALAEAARELAARSGKKTAAALDHMAGRLDDRRASLAPLDLNAARMSLKDVQAVAQVWPETTERQLQRGCERVARRARKARKRGFGAEDAPLRHDWRKREKERQYVLDILADLWSGNRKRRRKLGARLGEVLGEERDYLILIERLNADSSLAGDELAAARALKRLRRRAANLARRADAIGAALHRGGA